VTRDEALSVLRSDAGIAYEALGDIFAAFGFAFQEPSFGTVVYYHPDYPECGIFPARKWLDVLSQNQIRIVLQMVGIAIIMESAAKGAQTGG
jgi:hypothetical protein